MLGLSQTEGKRDFGVHYREFLRINSGEKSEIIDTIIYMNGVKLTYYLPKRLVLTKFNKRSYNNLLRKHRVLLYRQNLMHFLEYVAILFFYITQNFTYNMFYNLIQFNYIGYIYIYIYIYIYTHTQVILSIFNISV